MFAIEFLNALRSHELAFITVYLSTGKAILEIGGGTGFQAKALTDKGYEIVSIDVPQSVYATARQFPVLEYDGRRLPFGKTTFDVALSSNVLEHVPDLPALYREFDRVLREDGYGVHVMPTGSWRFWTTAASYIELLQRVFTTMTGALPRSLSKGEFGRLMTGLRESVKLCRIYAVPPRHGEFGNAFTEIWTFTRKHWIKHFTAHGFEVIDARAMGLFYTGHMILGSRLSLASRERAARWLGSSCVLYKVRRRMQR